MLGVAFVVLKLCGTIDWSWWWVTMPFWFGPAVLLTIAIAVGLGAGVGAICHRLKHGKAKPQTEAERKLPMRAAALRDHYSKILNVKGSSFRREV